MRSATRRVFENPCGGLVAQVSSSPINYEDAAGDWREIDPTLVRDGDGYRSRSGDVSVRLPTTLSDPTTIAHDDLSIAFALRGGGGAAAKVDDATASYAGVVDGTDIGYVATAAGLKEDIVVGDASAPTSYTYDLRLSSGMTARREDDGSISFLRDGDVVADIAAPFMHDAATRPAVSSDVRSELTRTGDGYALTLTPDREWVLSHLENGPVTIDPTVSFKPADPDCEIASASANTNLCSTSTLGVGVDSTTSAKRRSLLRFTIRRWLPKGARIFSARLSLKTSKLATGLTSVGAYDASRLWTSGVTWNKYDGTNAWTAAGGDYASTAVDTNTQVGDQLGGWEDWSVTASVQSWADTGNTNGGNGFLLKQTDETQAKGPVEFVSSNTGNPADYPSLFVWYDNMTGALPYYSFSQAQPITDRLSMGVNVAGGNLMLNASDLRIAGTGQDLDFSRAYNSREAASDRVGWGWTLGMSGNDVHVYQGTGDAVFRGPSDFTTVFKKNSDGSFQKPNGLDADLVKNSDGTYAITYRGSGQVMRFNAAGYLVERADRNGNKITIQYDASYNVTTIRDTQGRNLTLAGDATYGYRTGSVTDSTGRKTTYAYNTAINGDAAAGSLMTSSTDADGKVTRYGYTGSLLTSVTDPLNNVTTFAYDDDRRVTSVVRGGQTTTYAYAQSGTSCATDLNTVVTDPRGNKTTYCWEQPGRVTKVVDANGNVRSTSYNADSKSLTSTSGASGGPTSTYTYDATTGVLKTGARPAGETFSLTYGDPANKYSPTQATNPQGTNTLFAYDAKGNTTSVRDGGSPAQSQATLEYNGQSGGSCPASGPSGTIRCAIDGKGNQTRYGYDTAGNLTTITPPLPIGQTTLTYDALSRVKTITDGNGKVRTFTYDPLDRVTKTAYSDGTSVTNSYDADGNLKQRLDSTNGTWLYDYDARNNRIKDTLPGGATSAYEYDGDSNLTKLTDRSGIVNYAYNKTNRLSSLTEPDGLITTFGYDTRDNRTSTTYPNGVIETRSYDTSDKLKTIRAVKGTATPLTDFTYTYVDASNREGQLVRKEVDGRTGNTTTYGYDANDRLARALVANTTSGLSEDRTYSYDAANNRTQSATNGAITSYAYNNANQLCWKNAGASSNACTSPPTGAVTYTYDAAGNLKANSSGSAFVYNDRNQTTSITNDSGVTTAFGYGGDGQSELTKVGTKTYQNNLLGLGIQDGGTYGRVDFVREPSGRLFSTLEDSRRHYYLTDQQDSVVALANSSGTTGGFFRYDPYGSLAASSDRNVNNYMFWNGALTLTGGIWKFGERYDIANLGRWSQLDPIDSPADLRQANRYAYAADDPVNLTDPAGTDIFDSPFTRQVSGLYNKAKGVVSNVGKSAGGALAKRLYLPVCYGIKSARDSDNSLSDSANDLVACSTVGAATEPFDD